MKEAKKLEALEKKVNLMFTGYNKRLDQFDKNNSHSMIKLEQFNTELEIFKTLQQQEQKAVYFRFEDLNKFYQNLVDKESILQVNPFYFIGITINKIETI